MSSNKELQQEILLKVRRLCTSHIINDAITHFDYHKFLVLL